MNRKSIKSVAWILALVLSLSIVFTGCDVGVESTLPDVFDEGEIPAGQEDQNPTDEPEAPADDPKDLTDATEAPTDATEKPTDAPDESVDVPETPTDDPNEPTDAPEEPEDAPEGDTVVAQKDAEKALGVPAFSGSTYAEINNNIPNFDEDEITSESYEFYSPLDSLGRCGYTMACIGQDIMPTESRGDISSVKPTGWINKLYSAALVDGGYIYNRCHLIGFQLTGENANEKNLITGTRYMNADGMIPFENMVADYVKETGNHVMYRVTPIFDGNDLVACGVQIEAYSVEDRGEEICFNVYVYNVQPGITIDYATGESWLTDGSSDTDTPAEDNTGGEQPDYILNTSKKKIHKTDCASVLQISPKNYQEYWGDIEDLLDEGYTTCGACKPGD